MTTTEEAFRDSWAEKTTETLSDAGTHVPYTNVSGEVMLEAVTPAGAGGTWLTFAKYDGAARPLLSPPFLPSPDDTTPLQQHTRLGAR